MWSLRFDGTTLWLAPTDLGIHLECRHATTLALAYTQGAGPGPHTGGEYEQLIQAKGDLHERQYLSQLEAAGREIVEITLANRDFHAAARATEHAMRDGAEVIYQATFAEDGWRGRADFLERVPIATGLGEWGYEAVDTKLARREALPHHVLQLAVYSQWIERVQGVTPREMHLQLGSGLRETIRVADVAAYVRHAQATLRQAVTNPQATEAYPCSHCAVCGFQRQCNDAWDAADHLTRVAGIRRDTIDALQIAGIDTLAQLAVVDPGRPVSEVRPDALAALQWQARLQLQARRRGTLPYDRRDRAAGRGFARLPRPDPGDVFLDLEGDPFWDPARELWFLFGVVLKEDGEWRYKAIWGHDPEGEEHAFEELVDLMIARHAAHPGMHVYHYSPAEPSALRRLAAQPSTREAEVDDLLRAEVFVDLFAVIRQALVIGAPGYGLKVTEKLAGFTRTAETGSGSTPLSSTSVGARAATRPCSTTSPTTTRRTAGRRWCCATGCWTTARPARRGGRARRGRAQTGDQRSTRRPPGAARGVGGRSRAGVGTVARRGTPGVPPPRKTTRVVELVRSTDEDNGRAASRPRGDRRPGPHRPPPMEGSLQPGVRVGVPATGTQAAHRCVGRRRRHRQGRDDRGVRRGRGHSRHLACEQPPGRGSARRAHPRQADRDHRAGVRPVAPGGGRCGPPTSATAPCATC